MGQSQSAGARGAPQPDVEVKTSYYELLGVERTASDDDIKKAYRRKALELHPDRNYGDTERATALFAEIQTAYQVLSDTQERAWYDAHEGDILRGGDGGGGEDHYEHNMKVMTADDLTRMMGKFRGSVDFSDAPNGFFGFVREAFEQLAREEEHAADYGDVAIPKYHSFGHKDDTYDDVVRDFYNLWLNFSTAKTFAWMDVYRLSEAPDRRIRRLMEKENKKHRDEGIRQFNEAVRTLVAFVRKRDPRYTPNRQSDEDKAKAQRAARAAQAARSRAAHVEKMQDAVPEWAMARDPDEVEESTDEDIEEDHYECVACHKTFKSERQYEAHEKSKKHQKAVQALKRKMQKDNAHLHLDDDVTSSGVITPVSDEELSGDAALDASVENMADEIEELKVHGQDEVDDGDKPVSSPEAEGTPDKPRVSPGTESSEDDDDDEYASRSDIEARLASFRKDTKEDINNDEDEIAAPAAPKLGKAKQKKAKKAARQAEAGSSDFPHKCQVCNAGFTSKTQLFQHIKDLNHAALKSATGGASGKGKKGKKK